MYLVLRTHLLNKTARCHISGRHWNINVIFQFEPTSRSAAQTKLVIINEEAVDERIKVCPSVLVLCQYYLSVQVPDHDAIAGR